MSSYRNNIQGDGLILASNHLKNEIWPIARTLRELSVELIESLMFTEEAWDEFLTRLPHTTQELFEELGIERTSILIFDNETPEFISSLSDPETIVFDDTNLLKMGFDTNYRIYPIPADEVDYRLVPTTRVVNLVDWFSGE